MTLIQTTRISPSAPGQSVLCFISFKSQLMIQARLNEPNCGLSGGIQCFSTNDTCGLSSNPVNGKSSGREETPGNFMGGTQVRSGYHILLCEEPASFLDAETVLNFWSHGLPNTAQPPILAICTSKPTPPGDIPSKLKSF